MRGPMREVLRISCRHLASSPEKPSSKGESDAATTAPARWSPAWVWDKTKETALHYWHGTKLLVKDTRIASALFARMLRGRSLSRREHALLVRVLADLIRLLPLAFFVLVPFMEFALPFAIRLFPNLLPSTFEEKHIKEEKKIKMLKVRLEVAQVLEHTLEERALQMKRKRDHESGRESSAEELREFMARLREGGHASNPEELLRMMALFKDTLTIDAMDRPMLVSMCQFMGLNSFAPDGLLRWTLRAKLRQLRNDDKDIMWEGVGSLTDDELRAALRNRGLPSIGMSEDAMRRSLQEWLQVSQSDEIPNSLLLLANMYRYPRLQHDQLSGGSAQSEPEVSVPSQLIDILSAETAMTSIPAGAVDSALSESREVSPAEALALLEREQLLVEEEYEVRSGSAEVARAEEAAADAAKEKAEESDKAADKLADMTADKVGDTKADKVGNKVGEAAGETLKEAEGEVSAEKVEAEHSDRLSREQLQEIARAVETMSSESAFSRERQEMLELEKQRLEKRLEVEQACGDASALAMLDKRVSKMILALKAEMEKADGAIGKAFHSLDLDGDGVLSAEELLQAMDSINVKLRPQDAQFKQLLEQLDHDKDGRINLADLQELIREMQMRDASEDDARVRRAKEKLGTGTGCD